MVPSWFQVKCRSVLQVTQHTLEMARLEGSVLVSTLSQQHGPWIPPLPAALTKHTQPWLLETNTTNNLPRIGVRAPVLCKWKEDSRAQRQ